MRRIPNPVKATAKWVAQEGHTASFLCQVQLIDSEPVKAHLLLGLWRGRRRRAAALNGWLGNDRQRHLGVGMGLSDCAENDSGSSQQSDALGGGELD